MDYLYDNYITFCITGTGINDDLASGNIEDLVSACFENNESYYSYYGSSGETRVYFYYNDDPYYASIRITLEFKPK